jgi:hypothetical protein
MMKLNAKKVLSACALSRTVPFGDGRRYAESGRQTVSNRKTTPVNASSLSKNQKSSK